MTKQITNQINESATANKKIKNQQGKLIVLQPKNTKIILKMQKKYSIDMKNKFFHKKLTNSNDLTHLFWFL